MAWVNRTLVARTLLVLRGTIGLVTGGYRQEGSTDMGRILVAEDEKDLCLGIALTLRTDGHEVTETFNGLDAMEAIVTKKHTGTPYDLMVCDIQMPVIDGEELLYQLKKCHAALPTLVVTGYGEKNLLVRLLRAGCGDFIDKPFTPEILCVKVTAMLAETADTMREARRRKRLTRIGEQMQQTIHDFNTIIGGVLDYADMALMKLNHDNLARGNIEKMLATSHRAAEICQTILCSQWSSAGPLYVMTEMNTLIYKIAALLEVIAPAAVTVAVSAMARPVWLNVDADRMQQALLYLGFNAFNAMRAVGRLTISMRQESASRPGTAEAEMTTVVITVEDTAERFTDRTESHCGSAGNIQKYGNGRGIGLVQTIVEHEHDGWIIVGSNAENGMVLRLFLPERKI